MWWAFRRISTCCAMVLLGKCSDGWFTAPPLDLAFVMSFSKISRDLTVRGPLSIATFEVEIESTFAPAGDVSRLRTALAPPDGAEDADPFMGSTCGGEFPLARSRSA